MCGIVGIFGETELPNLGNCIEKMTETLLHRGPDSSGTWINQENKIALGHRRLSILELSEAGHQPMKSSCGRFVLSFNGEIYNTQNLIKYLPNIKLRGKEVAVKWYLKKEDASWHTFWDNISVEDELAEVKNDYPRMLKVIFTNSISRKMFCVTCIFNYNFLHHLLNNNFYMLVINCNSLNLIHFLNSFN